jgi:APA family basic amino acid/polyamine antiporter
VLGLAFGVAVVVGSTIGQGILRTPGLIAQGVPDASIMLLLWIAGGALALIDAMSTVELGASIPVAGGPYAFARRAFGPFTGLAVGVTDWLANLSSISYLSVVFAEYLHRLGFLTSVPLGVIAAVLPVMAGAIQWSGTKAAGLSQEIGSAVKAVIFVVLIVALLVAPRGTPVIAPTHLAPALSFVGSIVAIRAIYGAYSGWNGAVYFSEEVRDPSQSITRATFSGILVVTGIYVLIVVACLHILTIPEMAASNLVVADAAARVFGPVGETVMTIVSLISLATIINVSVMMFPRVLFAIGRDAGNMPGLSRVSTNGTPRVALIVTVVLSSLLATVGVYDLLLSLSVALVVAMSVAVNLAAIAMRVREPALARPYRMPLFPVPAIIAALVNAALLGAFVYEDPATSVKAVLLLGAIVVPAYAAIRWTRRAAAVTSGRDVI